MFHKAVDLRFLTGTTLEMRFQDGLIKRYDVSVLFAKYPQMEALQDRALFTAGKLSAYGIIWNDELDLEAETIYQDGITVGHESPANPAGEVVAIARAKAGLTQKQLAALTGIDQSDLSKLERGLSNPSIGTLQRIANALGGKLVLEIKTESA